MQAHASTEAGWDAAAVRDALRDAARDAPEGFAPPPFAPPGDAQEVVASSSSMRQIAECSLESLGAALGAPPLRAAVYLRTPDSFVSGRLRLARLAVWPRSGDGPGAQQGAARGALPFLPLPPPAPPVLDGASLPDPESLNAAPSVLVLPAAGAVVLPLRSDGVLLGLLVAERAGPSAPWAPPGAPWAGSARGEVGADGAAFSADARTALAAVARSLALAWALDQAAASARLASSQRARQLSAYLTQARSPLAAIRTLGGLLARQLAPDEPPRDLAAVIIEQSERLGDLTTSLQAALFPGTLLPAPGGASAQASLPGTAVAHAPAGTRWGDGVDASGGDDADTEELWSRPDEAGPSLGAPADQCDVGAVLRPLLGALDGVAQATGVAVIASLPGLGEAGAHDDDDEDGDRGGGGPMPLLAAISAADARRALSAALEATLHATPPGGTLQVSVRSSGAMLSVDVRCTADQMARAPAAAALRADAGLRLAADLLRSLGGACDPLPAGEPGVMLRIPLTAAQGLLPVDAHVEADALDAQIAEE
jgi:GAF domain-containing protein